VYNELETDKDKVAFMDALLDRQFQGVKPLELKGMAKFAYISQINSIDSQVKGYEDKAISLNKDVENYDPWQGVKNIFTTPYQQEKGKGKGKEQVEYTIPDAEASEGIDFDILREFVNRELGRAFVVVNPAVKKKYKATLKQGYTKQMIMNAILNCKKDQYHIDTNYKYCTIEYFSRPNTLDLHGTNIVPHSPNHGKIMLVDQIRILDHD
jgi:hypothetical protein